MSRLFVCTSASSLIILNSHWCVHCPAPGDSDLVAQQAQLRAAVRGVLWKSELAPARPVLCQEEIVREVAKSCGAETVPELVTSPQTTLPVDTPRPCSGPAEAAPAMVSVAPASAPVAAKLAAVAVPEAVR